MSGGKRLFACGPAPGVLSSGAAKEGASLARASATHPPATVRPSPGALRRWSAGGVLDQAPAGPAPPGRGLISGFPERADGSKNDIVSGPRLVVPVYRGQPGGLTISFYDRRSP